MFGSSSWLCMPTSSHTESSLGYIYLPNFPSHNNFSPIWIGNFSPLFFCVVKSFVYINNSMDDAQTKQFNYGFEHLN